MAEQQDGNTLTINSTRPEEKDPNYLMMEVEKVDGAEPCRGTVPEMSAIELRGYRSSNSEDPPPAYGNTDFQNGATNRSPSHAMGEGYGNQGFQDDGQVGSGHASYTLNEKSAEPAPGNDYHQTDEGHGNGNRAAVYIYIAQTECSNFYKNYKAQVWQFIYALMIVLYAIYFGYAMFFRFGDEGSTRLLWVTLTVLVLVFISVLWNKLGGKIKAGSKPCSHWCRQHNEKILWIAVIMLFTAIAIYIIVDVTYLTKRPHNLVSLSGIAVYISLFFIFSYDPAKVRWRPVAWGLGLQFIFALLILRTAWGFAAFKWMGDRVSEFLEHTDKGSKFVFGDKYLDHFFAFKVLPVVVFFSTVIAILYHLGWMQILIRKVAFVMQVLMGTTAAESLNAAGNIFIGQSESPLMIRPLINDMTRSELHAVMTGGFATIAGSVMAAYIQYGVPANHLISASVMSAPAALAMSKLFYPETEESKTTMKDVQHIERGPERNIIEAASAGASQSIKLVANIAVNLIAFLALLQFVNSTLTWLGHRVGIQQPHYPELTFELICAWVLWPFALFMGVDSQDCHKVAELIGIKTFLNEFAAYVELGKLLDNRVAYESYLKLHPGGNITYNKGDMFLVEFNQTLKKGYLTDRSEVIATYALCGFSNIGSIGIMLGALGAMAPDRKSELASIAGRAMIAGNVACFMTACIAGLLYSGDIAV